MSSAVASGAPRRVVIARPLTQEGKPHATHPAENSAREAPTAERRVVDLHWSAAVQDAPSARQSNVDSVTRLGVDACRARFAKEAPWPLVSAGLGSRGR